MKTEDSFIYFNEVLYQVMKRKYGIYKLSEKMMINELKT